MGSGFDILPLSKNADNQKGKKHAEIYSRVRFWEIDSREVLDKKEGIIQSNNIDKNATYIKMDYTKGNFVEKLIEAGLDPFMSTLVIWEGNLMYLEEKQAMEVIQNLKNTLTDFTIVFDYMTESFIKSLDEKSPLKKMWKTGIDNIDKFAVKYGFTVEDKKNIRDLEIEYGVDLNPKEDVGQYSVCALRKG